jgi:uncharacterized membrane protein YhhN
LFDFVFIAAAGFAIWTKYFKFSLYKFAKPLPLFLLLISALFYFNSSFYFIAFLFFSLSGDIFLIRQDNASFKAGIAAFLLAHLFLIAEFLNDNARFTFVPTLVVAALSVTYYFLFLKNRLGKMKIPVIIYLTVISLMLALSFWYANSRHALVLGTILFYYSDAVLAYGKFVRKYRFTDLISLAAYFTGELLIFHSILF